jgi:hypothetical protein
MVLTQSKNAIPIRLTQERLSRIFRNHPDMEGQEDKILETVSKPDYIQQGDDETKIAVRLYPHTPLTKKFAVVVYRESQNDGFIITSYFATEPAQWRKILWKR